MDDIKISLDTGGSSGELTVVRVDGVIDTMTSSELEKVMNTLLVDQKKYKLIVDLAGVDYISSAGWGIFISNIREIRANSGDLKLARMIPSVYEIFELLEFDSILKAYDNIEKAKSDFKKPGSVKEEKPQPVPKQAGSANSPSASLEPEIIATEVMTEEFRPQIETPAARISIPDTEVAAAENKKSISVEGEILGLVKADPFYSIRELVKLVNTDSNGSDKQIGWWGVWKVLRRNSLLSKKNRFRFSRKP